MNDVLEFFYTTFEEAMDKHTKMFEKLREQGYVTDYDCGCICIDNFLTFVNPTEAWLSMGWTDLQNMRVEKRHEYGWCLIIPYSIELNLEKEII